MPVARVRGPGHPDQVCDLVAAAIVEEYERRDPDAKLHVRVMGGHGALFVAGEVASQADFDVSSTVRRVLGACGVREDVEPFIALEPMVPGWACEAGARDGAVVVGYATKETVERSPTYVVLAERVARLIEAKRSQDEDWFWLDSDYEVVVERVEQKHVTVIRAGHADGRPLSEVRAAIHRLLTDAGVQGPIRINPAGEEIRVGLAHRVGASARATMGQGMGSLIPSTSSGAGLHTRHPSNIGTWLARAAARECIRREQGDAVLITVSWLPMEARPHHIRIRNERGDDLGQAIKPEFFDLKHIPEGYLANPYLVSALSLGYLPVDVPWEQDATK